MEDRPTEELLPAGAFWDSLPRMEHLMIFCEGINSFRFINQDYKLLAP